MTDDTTTGGSEPTREEAERLARESGSDSEQSGSEQSGSGETQGAATEGEPLSESTDGGLEGGDPGVEE